MLYLSEFNVKEVRRSSKLANSFEVFSYVMEVKIDKTRSGRVRSPRTVQLKEENNKQLSKIDLILKFLSLQGHQFIKNRSLAL